MKCPFCGEELIEGNLQCQNCRRLVIDFDYHENLNRMEEKYSKTGLGELSKEKLTFEEIITILTFIERADHHGGDGEVTDACSRDGTFANLSRQLREMRK